MKSGKKVEREGTAMSKATFKKSAIKNGITPLYMTPMGTSTVPINPNRLSPKGGVINPISTIRTIVRAFVKLREMLATHKDLEKKLIALEKKYDKQFKVVF